MENVNTSVDEFIIKTLKRSKEPLSTYSIAKHIGISWSTANTHCYKLQSMGIMRREIKRSHIGQKTMFWYLVD